jgi:hypothetical protein
VLTYSLVAIMSAYAVAGIRREERARFRQRFQQVRRYQWGAVGPLMLMLNLYWQI